MDLGSPKVEPDSSSKPREGSSSLKSHRHQVSAAVGSSTSLEKSTEQNHDMDHKVHVRKTENATEIVTRAGTMINCEADHGHPREKDWHCATMPQVMTVLWPLSLASRMNLVIPWSITIQRSGDYAVKVHHMAVSVDTPAHQTILFFQHLWYFIQLW